LLRRKTARNDIWGGFSVTREQILQKSKTTAGGFPNSRDAPPEGGDTRMAVQERQRKGAQKQFP